MFKYSQFDKKDILINILLIYEYEVILFLQTAVQPYEDQIGKISYNSIYEGGNYKSGEFLTKDVDLKTVQVAHINVLKFLFIQYFDSDDKLVFSLELKRLNGLDKQKY